MRLRATSMALASALVCAACAQAPSPPPKPPEPPETMEPPEPTPPAVLDYDQPPRAIKLVKPLYPAEAFNKKIEGTVEIEILIDASGTVSRARILKSIPLLDQAALDTVYQWTFTPAIKNGHPVATIARAPVMFRIYSAPTPPPRP